MDYSVVLSEILSNTDILIKLFQLCVGLLFAKLILDRRKYL